MSEKSDFGKVLRRPSDIFFQQVPIKSMARIFFPTGRNVFVPRNVGNGKVPRQCAAKSRQTCVLHGLKRIAIQPLQFNANAVVVAIGAATIVGVAGMPSTFVATDKLPKLAGPFNEKMRGHLQAANALVVGVTVPRERVGKKLLHGMAAVLAWGQANGVHHNQVDVGLRGPRPKVG